jgi:hypothetical protein
MRVASVEAPVSRSRFDLPGALWQDRRAVHFPALYANAA